MECRQIEHDLALIIGADLADPVRERAVRRHVAGCDHCQQRVARLQNAHGVLQQSLVVSASDEARPSLWPRVSAELAVLHRPGVAPAVWSRSQVWAPTLAVVAAAVIVLAVVVPLLPPSQPSNDWLTQTPVEWPAGERNLFLTDPQFFGSQLPASPLLGPGSRPGAGGQLLPATAAVRDLPLGAPAIPRLSPARLAPARHRVQDGGSW